MDVSGSGGERLVLAAEAVEGDVVADDVLVGVDAVVEQASGALEAAGVGVHGVDDLIRASDDAVGGGEDEGERIDLLGLGHGGGLGQGNKGQESESGLHGELRGCELVKGQ